MSANKNKGKYPTYAAKAKELSEMARICLINENMINTKNVP